MTTLPISPETPWLAPLAGYSDLPFRLLCRFYGAAVTCTEMVSAKGLVYQSPGTADLLRTIPEDNPVVVQLFGTEIDFIEKAMHILLAQGFTYFDLNMGCSVPKVVRTGSGAAMLKDMEHSLAVAKAMLCVAGKGRVGFKIRLGWDDASPIWQELPLRLQDLGAGWITLHPRTARQGFGGKAHWPALKELAQLLTIPLIASGDLLNAEDGLRCLQETKVSGLMYARGAMQNPAIFADHAALLQGKPCTPPSPEALLSLIRQHRTLACEHSNPAIALRKMRTFAPRYVQYVPGARALRHAITQCTSWDELDMLLENALQKTETT